MKISASLPTGVAALFFDSARRRRRIEQCMVQSLESNGFEEVVLPVVDYLDPYEEMPAGVRRDELYRFVDRDGEVLALRSDFTTMVARLIAPRLPPSGDQGGEAQGGLQLPLNLFYRGDVLRYGNSLSGGEREFYQVGAEVLGLDGEAGERQATVRFLDLLEVSERRPILLVLGFAGALDMLLSEAGDPAALAASVVRRERRALRTGSPALLEVVEHGVPADPQALGASSAERLARLRDLVAHLGERFPRVELRIDLAEFADQVLDPDLRRRLAHHPYYDGLVFRAFAGRAAEPVGAGGRYDRLFQRLGVEEVTAAGFSISLDQLWESAEGEPQ